MRLTTALLPFSLLALAACGGDSNAAEADVFKLVQSGDYSGAITAAETQLASVEKGTEEHKELVIQYATALAKDQPEKAKDEFLAFAKANSDSVEPTDFRYVDGQLRKHDHLVVSVELMDAGMKRWPGDPVMKEVLDGLKQQIASSGDSAAASKMKGLGYM